MRTRITWIYYTCCPNRITFARGILIFQLIRQDRSVVAYARAQRVKMFIESLGLNPDEILSREAMSKPHRTVVDPEDRKIDVLNDALKHAILKELRKA